MTVADGAVLCMAGLIFLLLRWACKLDMNAFEWNKVSWGKDGTLPDYDVPVLWRTEEGNYFVDAIDKDDFAWWRGDTKTGRPACTHWAYIRDPKEKKK